MYADGKQALRISASNFNKVASTAYKELSEDEKQRLLERCASPQIRPMSRRAIMKSGKKSFRKIHKEVSCNL